MFEQAIAVAEERALPVVAAVAVTHAAVAVAVTAADDTPLLPAEFERDEDFRVLRRFLSAYRIGQHAALLQEVRNCRDPASSASPRRTPAGV